MQSTEVATAPAASAKRGLIKTWTAVLLHPAEFFESLQAENRLGPPIGFAYLMVLASFCVVAASAFAGLSPTPKYGLSRMVVFMAVRLAELPLLAGFLGGLFIWFIGRILGNAGVSYKQSVGIACYSMAIFPLSSLAGLLGTLIAPQVEFGQVVWLYGFYIVAKGIIALHRSRPVPTFVVLAVLGLMVESFSFFAMKNARTPMEQLAKENRGAAGPGSAEGPNTTPVAAPPTAPAEAAPH